MSSLLRTTTPLAFSARRSLSTSAAVRYASKPSTSTTQSSDSSEKNPARPQHDTVSPIQHPNDPSLMRARLTSPPVSFVSNRLQAETIPSGQNTLPGSGSSNPQDRVPGEQNKTGGKGDQTEKKSEGKET